MCSSDLDQRDEIAKRIKVAESRISSLSAAEPNPASSGDSVTVGGKTYTRPAGFTDEQWNAYKKSQGIK